MAWYDAPVTQPFGVAGEKGIDLGTAFGTPITALNPGTVDVAKVGPYGGLVGEQTRLGEEYFLHLDQINVSQGQQISSGQVLGLSGGQNVGGTNPAAPAYSSGPHTEYGIFQGALFASPSIDPAGVIASARAGGVGGLQPSLPNPSDVVGGIGRGVANGITAALQDVATFFKRQIIALAVAVVVAIVLLT